MNEQLKYAECLLCVSECVNTLWYDSKKFKKYVFEN